MTQITSADPGDKDEVRFLNLALVLAENARLLLLLPLAAGVIALGITFAIQPTFTSVTRILPPSAQQSALGGVIAGQLGALAAVSSLGILGARSITEVYVALAKTRTVADRMVDRFQLMERYDTKSREIARKKLEAATRIDIGKGGLVIIEVDDRDPQQAAGIANGYVRELIRMNGELAITDAQQRRTFFERQLRQTRENLKNAETVLGSTGASESLIKSSPQAIVENIARLRASISALEIKIAAMKGYLTDTSPDMESALRELGATREQLRKAEQNQPAQGRNGTEYLDRFRDFKYQEALFELMAKQLELARLDEMREGAAIQIIDVAMPPEFKSSPRRALVAMATSISVGVILLVFVLFRESLRIAGQEPQSADTIRRIMAALRGVHRRK